MARRGAQNAIRRSARETNAMNDTRSSINYEATPPRYTPGEVLREGADVLAYDMLKNIVSAMLKRHILRQIQARGAQKIFITMEYVMLTAGGMDATRLTTDGLLPNGMGEQESIAMLTTDPQHAEAYQAIYQGRWNTPIIEQTAPHANYDANWHRTKADRRVNPTNIDRFLSIKLKEVKEQCIGKMMAVGYNSFLGFRNISVVMIDSNPIAGAHVDIPEWLLAKKAVINIKNTDNRCFGYALAAAKQKLDKDRHARPNLYEPEEWVVVPKGCLYPVCVSSIERWECANKANISIYELPESAHGGPNADLYDRMQDAGWKAYINDNPGRRDHPVTWQNACEGVAACQTFFSSSSDFQQIMKAKGVGEVISGLVADAAPWSELKRRETDIAELSKQITPIHVSRGKYETYAPMLMYKKHYMWIKNWDRLFSKNNERKFICKCCLDAYSKPEYLANHVKDCEFSLWCGAKKHYIVLFIFW